MASGLGAADSRVPVSPTNWRFSVMLM